MDKEEEFKMIGKKLADIINSEIEKDGLDNVVKKYDLNKVDRYTIQTGEFNGKISKAIEILSLNNKRFIIQDENENKLYINDIKPEYNEKENVIKETKPKVYFKSDMYGIIE
jgi:hypothetical protein